MGVKVTPDGCDWVLTIRWAETHDAGLYECQVSSHPPQALMVNLQVVVAHAEIHGGPERYIHSGSSLMLVCLLKGATEPPVYVFWYRGDRMINYDKERGVTVDNTRKASKLYVASVSRSDEGNYTCMPSNASPASVSVTSYKRRTLLDFNKRQIRRRSPLLPLPPHLHPPLPPRHRHRHRHRHHPPPPHPTAAAGRPRAQPPCRCSFCRSPSPRWCRGSSGGSGDDVQARRRTRGVQGDSLLLLRSTGDRGFGTRERRSFYWVIHTYIHIHIYLTTGRG
nr:neurotrimin-like [Penaeus vannamei]